MRRRALAGFPDEQNVRLAASLCRRALKSETVAEIIERLADRLVEAEDGPKNADDFRDQGLPGSVGDLSTALADYCQAVTADDDTMRRNAVRSIVLAIRRH